MSDRKLSKPVVRAHISLFPFKKSEWENARSREQILQTLRLPPASPAVSLSLFLLLTLLPTEPQQKKKWQEHNGKELIHITTHSIHYWICLFININRARNSFYLFIYTQMFCCTLFLPFILGCNHYNAPHTHIFQCMFNTVKHVSAFLNHVCFNNMFFIFWHVTTPDSVFWPRDTLSQLALIIAHLNMLSFYWEQEPICSENHYKYSWKDFFFFFYQPRNLFISCWHGFPPIRHSSQDWIGTVNKAHSPHNWMKNKKVHGKSVFRGLTHTLPFASHQSGWVAEQSQKKKNTDHFDCNYLIWVYFAQGWPQICTTKKTSSNSHGLCALALIWIQAWWKETRYVQAWNCTANPVWSAIYSASPAL